jgi:L-rhamnonate dehydratase
MNNSKIDRIECVPLIGTRPRQAGCNSRLQVHGLHVRPPIARITTDDGATGFGLSRLSEEDTAELVGAPLSEAFDPENGVSERFRGLEYPLWDLAGKLAGKPVYEMLGGEPDEDGVFRARCYDTSLYIDDLHLADDNEAAALIASEALEGKARGHTAYKIKVGRGAMHMPLQQGTHRDILVIRAVRNAVGPDATILIDANNGYNLNLTKHVLSETADAKVYWMEEAFHEDASFYANLREWLNSEGLETKIADGEGGASLNLLQWAEEGLVDIIQYDIFHPGFTRWLELGPQLDEWNVGSAPHHYGGHYGNYVSCHLSAAIQGFEFTEWDEADTPGLDDSGYSISDGLVSVPNSPGFGLNLDEEIYTRAVQENGFVVRAA